VAKVLGPGPEWHTRLLGHEILSPSFALDEVVREFMRPRFNALRETLAPLLPGASERELSLHALSVIGQIVYHRVAAPVALRLLRERSHRPALVEEIATHIVGFTLAAIAARSGR
jgi:hypothetical protein